MTASQSRYLANNSSNSQNQVKAIYSGFSNAVIVVAIFIGIGFVIALFIIKNSKEI